MVVKNDTVVVVIDVQGKLAGLMHQSDQFLDALGKLIEGVKALHMPLIWMEQYPEKLGKTVACVAEKLTDLSPLSKQTFSCCGADTFMEALRATGYRQVLLCGIEAHICVYQTAADLVQRGYHTEVVTDAVRSRTPENYHLGLHRAEQAGAVLTSVEMVLFELLQVAGTDTFRQVSKILK